MGEAEVLRQQLTGALQEPPDHVDHWLEVQDKLRLLEAQAVQQRALAAAERSAASSEKSARMAAFAAVISLVAILITMVKEWGWFDR